MGLGVHIFPKGISPKVNVIAWLEFELVYFEAAVQHFSQYAKEIAAQLIRDHKKKKNYSNWSRNWLILWDRVLNIFF